MAAGKTAGTGHDGAGSGGRDLGELWVVGALVLVLALWVATPFAVPALIGLFGRPDAAGQYNNSGLFSDMFGAVNSLFTGVAFVGVAYTIILQRRELRGQVEELQRQQAAETEQLSRYQAQLALDREALELQRAENARQLELHGLERQRREAEAQRQAEEPAQQRKQADTTQRIATAASVSS